MSQTSQLRHLDPDTSTILTISKTHAKTFYANSVANEVWKKAEKKANDEKPPRSPKTSLHRTSLLTSSPALPDSPWPTSNP